jgi:Glycosyl transferase family 2
MHARSAQLSGNLACLPRLPTVSVVIAAFTMSRWDDLREAVASVRAQTAQAAETIVVIDHCPDLLTLARRTLSDVTVVANVGSRGAGGARNSGVASSRGEVVAFIDDDAFASRTWLENLLPHFVNPGVVGVGGRLDPLWAGSRPRWFPQEFDWAVGASYKGMPDSPVPVRNVWSGNMAIRRRVFDAIGGFRDDFGKLGERSRPEDTDLCLRAALAQDRGTWIYEPAAGATHRVPPQRATLGFFLRRCLNEGSGKAALAALNGASQSTSAERLYTRRVLPRGIARGVREMACGDASGGLRSITIAAGFALAMTGFLAGRVAGGVHRSCPPQSQSAPVTGQAGEEAARGANSR